MMLRHALKDPENFLVDKEKIDCLFYSSREWLVCYTQHSTSTIQSTHTKMPRCIADTIKGARCKRNACRDSDVCSTHYTQNKNTQEAQKQEEENAEKCPICLESLYKTSTITTTCNHKFCTSCLVNHMNSRALKAATILSPQPCACPMCRTPISHESMMEFSVEYEYIKTCERMMSASMVVNGMRYTFPDFPNIGDATRFWLAMYDLSRNIVEKNAFASSHKAIRSEMQRKMIANKKQLVLS